MSFLKYNLRPQAAKAPAFLLAAVMVGITAGWTPATAQSPVAGPSASPPGTAAASMTLKEAAQQAVLSNPEVLARWHTIRATQGERDAAKGALLPRADLNLANGRERTNIGSGTRSANSLSLTQLLYDGSATRNEIERLDHATRVRIFEFFDTSEAVALEAVRAYVDVLRYRELVRLAEDNFVEHRTVFSQTEQRVKARVAPSVDLEQVSGRLALAESNLLTETANLHDTTARFQRIVGRLPPEQISLPPFLSKEIPADAGTALLRAQERHGAVLAAIENVRASNSALASRKGAFGPRVDFRLRKEQSSSVNTANSNTNGTAAEVLLTWNLFNGFSDQARERQFAEQVNAARDLRDKACRDTRQTLVIAYNDVGKLTEQTQYLALHESSTAKALTAYRLQFSIGQRTLLSLLDTGNELFQARRAVTNARHDLHFAYARTQAGVGNLLRALELTSLEAEPLAITAGSDLPSECPPEPVGTFVSNKEALNARAALLLAQAAPAIGRAAPSPTVAPAASAASPASAAPQPAATEQTGVAAVKDALEGWRSAWAQLNVSAYLNAYATGFVPSRGISRAAWEANRRNTLGRAKDLSISVEDVAVRLQDDDHATTTFKQVYRSAGYRDQVTKTMHWERIDKRWLVVGETASESR